MDNLIDSTTNENDYRLFSVSQAARACSLSRSSLIRLEEKGIPFAPEPLFSINERMDYLEGNITSASYDFAICIPVLPKQAPEDAVSIPGCTALSLLVYGDYGKLNEAYLYLGEQVRSRGLTPAGYVRTISLVGPYVGKEIDPGRYCSRLVLPIEGGRFVILFRNRLADGAN